jgi:hypothetical protein
MGMSASRKVHRPWGKDEERPMQDALLIYYVVANLLHAGYFAGVVEVAQRGVERLRAAATGLRNLNTMWRAVADGRSQMMDQIPAVCREFEDWVERLTRMESYVLSVR